MNELRNGLDAISELAGPAAERVKAISATATVESACRVTVDARGRLVDVEFGKSALARSPQDAAALVIRAYREACANADAQASEALREFQAAIDALTSSTTAEPRTASDTAPTDNDDVTRFDFRTNRWR